MRPSQTYMKTMNTEEFIMLHRNDDVRTLALKAAGTEGIDLGYALNQIAGWQTARKKLPQWAADSGIKYPPHISMEQCSSEQTATYKANIAQRLINKLQIDGKSVLVDLTGGLGVDFSYMARHFGQAVYVERQNHLCELAQHNISVLGISQAEVVCADSEQFMGKMGHVTMIFADPARRDSHGGRTFAVADCTPDVLAMRDDMLAKADFVMLKLSPMLDWHKTVADFGNCVGEVHIVSTGNECKELLLVMSAHFNGLTCVTCVNDDSIFSYNPQTDIQRSAAAESDTDNGTNGNSSRAPLNLQPGMSLYEPNPSVMKAGCFGRMEAAFGARQISRDSHLFVSEQRADGFPGRAFVIKAISSMNRKELKKALGNTGKANITTRNFPMKAEELRKRLKLGDGGNCYIMATTTADGSHVLIICAKE